ncbi:MAG: MotA/TolQ/ExbB proton channel family protein [Balneola sp.]|nr:MotA/TolQ/ExbB proton channel family protein [Balneola sp.]MBO6650398.1 MotA/TolQ/ExbB proton channel family protein [Balneola sp.]MBO6710206.1 MotA/TolQ/ExbB proton channel family protein [Balneola sp.]MBO6798891.1 MotA/TolQ/ExbB proton channel family protein [Balneola sp.]MBO6870005.1 MotA/TolQ/ExbB proton channel family protein [Balneola sp.]
MRTSFLNILSFLVSLAILVWGALLVVGFAQFSSIPAKYEFLNLPSLAIVFGGISASVFISYPFKKVIKALRESTRLFSQSNIDDKLLEQDIERILEWQKRIRIDKVNAISELSEEYSNQFEGYLFSILDTNYSNEDLRELAEINIQETFTRQQQINQIIGSMGKTAPVFGMLGTLFGLIVILSGFNEMNSLLTGLAAALMTTLYGIVIGNFIFVPMSKKMNNIASLQFFREKLILEGILLIQEQKSSLLIYDKLKAHMHRASQQF